MEGLIYIKKIIVLILCGLSLLAFCSCAVQSDSPQEQPDAAIATQTPEDNLTAPPSESIQPEPTPTDDTPADDNTPISEISIDSAEAWNDFARSYNAGSSAYTEDLTIYITAPLYFGDTSFVPIYSGFSGTICGQRDENIRYDIHDTPQLPSKYYGQVDFGGITSIENISGEPVDIPYPYNSVDFSYQSSKNTSLFGIRCKTLTLKNVTFGGINTDYLSHLLTRHADELILDNVGITDCNLHGYAFLAETADNVSCSNLSVENSSLFGCERMSGLVLSVNESAKFENINFLRSSFILQPDNGGSGFWSSEISLLANKVYGNASFENICFYSCQAEGLSVYALVRETENVEYCKNIEIERCSLLCYKRGDILQRNILFYDDKVVKTENVSIINCLLSTSEPLETFEKQGYIIKGSAAILPEE